MVTAMVSFFTVRTLLALQRPTAARLGLRRQRWSDEFLLVARTDRHQRLAIFNAARAEQQQARSFQPVDCDDRGWNVPSGQNRCTFGFAVVTDRKVTARRSAGHPES
jgi:hypothetical protein